MIRNTFFIIAIFFIVISNLFTNISIINAGDCAKCVTVEGDKFDCVSRQPTGGDSCTVNGTGTECEMEGPCGQD